jgi:transposase
MVAFWPPMLTQEQAVEIRVRARQGASIHEIARQMGCSRNTVRRYLRNEQAVRYGPRAPRPCKLDEFHEYLHQRIEAARPHWIPATVLLREIRERGYTGGISQLKAYVAPFKRKRPGKSSCPERKRLSDASRRDRPAVRQQLFDATCPLRG